MGAGSVVDAGKVGTATAPDPAMSGHQHGASDPWPWCIDDGIES